MKEKTESKQKGKASRLALWLGIGSEALRSLDRMASYTILSLLGLVLSLSGTVIITRYLHQEWTVDHWIPDRDRIGLVMMKDSVNSNWYLTGDQKQAVETLRELSAVEATTGIFLRSLISVKTEGGESYTVCAINADSDFVKVFPLKTAEGVLSLKAEGDVIISESLARRMFPGESAVGKTFHMDGNVLHTVKGVFRKPSGKSLLQYDLVGNSETRGYYNNYLDLRVVKLIPSVSIEQFNESSPEITYNYASGEKTARYHLKPFEYILASPLICTFPCVSSISSSKYLWMLLAVGVLLFFVGVFNFLNLHAVVRRKRRHEMQVRRIFGASKSNLFVQQYLENFILSALGMLGVWMVIELTTPHMKEWFSIEQITMPLFDTVLSLSIMFILPLIATVRPTPSRPTPNPSRQGGEPFGLRKVNKAQLLPSLTGGAGGGSSFLFLQYFISLTLITVSIYMMRQLREMMQSDPGFRTESVLSCLPTSSEWEVNLSYAEQASIKNLFKQKMQECPFVLGFCQDPGLVKATPEKLISESGMEMARIALNEQLTSVLGLEVVEGRTLCDSLDSHTIYHCVLSETALERLGLKNWRTEGLTLRNHVFITQETDRSQPPHYEVVGIVKDIHPGRRSEPIPPIMFYYSKDKYQTDAIIRFFGTTEKRTLVAIEPGHEAEVVRFMKNVVKEVYGNNNLDYHWLSDEVKDLYKEDRRAARIFTTFALLAVGVTCLGVLGLMMFEIRRRYREIALRKVHGAGMKDIALLLCRRYLIILGVAACVSIPVSLIGLHKLITRYYTIHATIAWWIPLLSLLIVLALSALTLWYQLWRAMRIEPSVVMKVE